MNFHELRPPCCVDVAIAKKKRRGVLITSEMLASFLGVAIGEPGQSYAANVARIMEANEAIRSANEGRSCYSSWRSDARYF